MAGWRKRVDRKAESFTRNASLGPAADRLLKDLSQAANHGKLWLGAAGGLALMGSRGRVAAGQGLLSLAAASALANLVFKPLRGGDRPNPDLLSELRRLKQQPRSGSFPSGHSASAAAFAVGASLSWPAAAPVLVPAALAVAYSRLHTGAHWLSDVLAGLAVGAASGCGVHALWKALDQDALDLRQPVASPAEVPALPAGQGLVVVVNPHSGPSSEVDAAEQIGALLPQARILVPGRDGAAEDIDSLLDEAVAWQGIKALGISGGDGTVSAAAGVARANSLPLAVFPGGTLNHFAKAIRADTHQTAARAVQAGSGRSIDVADLRIETPEGGVNTKTVLNTFSLGAYADMVIIRDKMQERFGKWGAGILAAIQVVRGGVPAQITANGDRHESWLTFVGINTYVPAGLAPATRRRLDTGNLDVRDYRTTQRLAPVRLVARSVLGNRGTRALQLFSGRSEPKELLTTIDLTCTSGLNPKGEAGVDLAHDGETVRVKAPEGSSVHIRLDMARGGLATYAP